MKLNSTYLFQKCDDFDFDNPPFDPKILSDEVSLFIKNIGALGVAANQLGLTYRVFAISIDDDIIVCFNPEIVSIVDNKMVQYKEGCLSYPNLYIDIKRPQSIHVRYYNPNGDKIEQVLDGIIARAFMHELDHLEGITFKDRISELKWALAVKQSKKRNR